MAKIIVFGNEKGGSGKSTTAIHVAIGLCYKDKSVGVIDLDVRQKSMSRFLENRPTFVRKKKLIYHVQLIIKFINLTKIVRLSLIQRKKKDSLRL